MRQKLLLLLLGVLMTLPALARDFVYEYENVTLIYKVIDDEARTCRVSGYKSSFSTNDITLVIPDVANDGTTDYSVIEIGWQAFKNFSKIISVEIGNSVQTIDYEAFNGCSRLQSLVLGHTVETIDYAAFSGCISLTSVVIPNSVQTIGENAFTGCSGLTSVVIPNSVQTIGSYAFRGCSGLTSVAIGKSVESIGESAFKDCVKLQSAEFSSIESLCNIDFRDGEANPLKYAADLLINGEKVTNLVIPETVNSIGDYAFYKCSGLTSVQFGNSVQTIGNSAFSGCSGLKSVEIPNSVKTIGKNAFNASGLTSMIIPPSVTSIGEYAFWNCVDLEKGAYPNNLEYPFDGFYTYAVSYNPEGVIIEDGWVWGPEKTEIRFVPSNLKGEYTIPESVTSIGNGAFSCCRDLTSVVISNSVQTIGKNVFYACSGMTSVVIGNSVQTIGDDTFNYCSGLTSLTALSVSPAYMNDYLFEGLYDIVKLTVPDESVNNYLATNWSLFKNIQINSGTELGYFSDGVLEYRLNPTDMTATVIGAKSYSELQIPERFTDDSDAANPVRYYITGIGYKAFDGKDVKSVEFNSRSQMEYIGDYAFANTSISSISLPETIKRIGDYAFCDTKNLSNIELKEGLESIGSKAFGGYRSYSDITPTKPLYMPSTVNSVGKDAFQYFLCAQVDISDLNAWLNIDFGNDLANPLRNSDKGFLYVNGEKLSSLKVPEDIKEIKPYAFYYCLSLEDVTFPEGLEKIGTHSFKNCSHVTEVTIPASVVELGDDVFGQSKVTLADGLLPISCGKEALYGVRDLCCGRPVDGLTFNREYLSTLKIGNLVTEIYDSIFKDLTKLETLSLGSSIQSIGDEAFSGCTSLEEVILPPSVETIGASAFAGDSKLESIIMGHKVKTIGEKAFDGCKANTVSITAQTPPTAPNNTFSNYTGKLYVQGEKAKDAYYDAFTCWDRFDSYVMIDAEEIKIEGADKIYGKAGDTFQLTASVWPENVTLPQIFWRSTNPEIATVDGNGLVTLHVDLKSLDTRAGGEGDIDGVCTIIAETLYNDGPVAQIGVTAEDDTPILVESLTIDPTAWSGEEGNEFTIVATVLPENAEDKTLTFESSDDSIATVDAEGNVKVLKEGTCVITVSTVDGSNLKAECVVTGLSGVEAIFADPNAQVDVYDMNGVMLKKGCSREELKQLKPAVYILRSGNAVVKAVVR